MIPINDINTERFWEKVTKGESCWLWTAATDRGGYGEFKVGGKMRRAHHIPLALAGITVPDGMEADHLCRNRACVKPDHIEIVNKQENIRRGMGLQAINARKNHCDHGHEFTPENTRLVLSHGRQARACRTCNREAVRRYKERSRKEAA